MLLISKNRTEVFIIYYSQYIWLINWFIIDTHSLLQMLRVSKFSQLKARKLIDNTYSLEQEVPGYFKDLDTSNEKLQEFINIG